MEGIGYVVASAFAATVFLIFLVKASFVSRLLIWIFTSRPYKKFFAYLIFTWNLNYPNLPLLLMREKLLAQVVAKLSENGGDVLEIGIANGQNIQFMKLPTGSSLIAVFTGKYKKFSENNVQLKKFVVEDAANMESIDDNSVALVLGTQIHCSLEEKSVKKTLSEIKRVLKPGGYYFFIEHVIDKRGTRRCLIQGLAAFLMSLILDGCRCDKETWKYIEEAGFKKVSYQQFMTDVVFYWSAPFLSFLRYLTCSRISGFAIKGKINAENIILNKKN